MSDEFQEIIIPHRAHIILFQKLSNLPEHIQVLYDLLQEENKKFYLLVGNKSYQLEISYFQDFSDRLMSLIKENCSLITQYPESYWLWEQKNYSF